jgi:hypothetical protein
MLSSIPNPEVTLMKSVALDTGSPDQQVQQGIIST